MCGIVGAAGARLLPSIPAMLDRMVHRGPDDSGTFVDPERGVALAMRRLSIIDLSGGHQPMSNEDDGIWVVCNGEIYNSPELRAGLERKGHRFKTRNSDIEVLLHLYEEKGFDMLGDLNGMYAFVLYDKRKGILFGARDRMGIKPLYYSLDGGKLAFASELKNLLALPGIGRDIDPASLYHYLSLQFVPGPASILKGIRKLEAGCYLVFDLAGGGFEERRYWDLRFGGASPAPGGKDLPALVRQRFGEALKRWTLSDVPIACSLSGGIDSSAVVGMLAQSGYGRIKTYSLGFPAQDGEGFDELELARKVAGKWGTDHHELILEPETLLRDLDKMVWHLDEPYGGGLPSWYIYEFIAKDCKVAMTGSGGDELFGNYGKWQILERPLPWRLARGPRLGLGVSGALSELADGLRHPHGHFFQRYLSDAAKDALLVSGGRASGLRGTERLIEDLWSRASAAGPRNASAYVDFRLQLPEEFLLVTDRFSMAHALEARVPFLDHELVEFVFSIPPEVRTRRGDLKYLLKAAVRDLLPDELFTAPKKGFILPLPHWTRNQLRGRITEALEPGRLRSQGLFSPRLWDDVVKPHLEGRRDHTQQVWTFFMFQLWHRAFVEAGAGR